MRRRRQQQQQHTKIRTAAGASTMPSALSLAFFSSSSFSFFCISSNTRFDVGSARMRFIGSAASSSAGQKSLNNESIGNAQHSQCQHTLRNALLDVPCSNKVFLLQVLRILVNNARKRHSASRCSCLLERTCIVMISSFLKGVSSMRSFQFFRLMFSSSTAS